MRNEPRGFNRRHFVALAASGAALSAIARRAPATVASDVVDVAIIGGGLAGLTAARDLARAGNDSFVVLEARDRVGGRTLNHDLGNGYFSEAGGQWIGPGQTAIADLLRELGISTFPTYYEGKTVILANGVRAAIDGDGSFGTDPTLAHELEALAKSVPSGAPWTSPRAAEFDSKSFGDWLATKQIAPADQISWTMAATLTAGAAPARLSLLYYLSLINSAGCNYERLEGIKGGAQQTRISGGSQIVSLRMAEALGHRVRLSTPVLRIENWERGPVALITPNGTVKARSVVVTLTPALCNQIAFDPPLPEKRRELQRRWPASAAFRKVALVYPKAFWRDAGLNGWVVQAQGPVIWAFDNSPEDVSFGVLSAFVNQGMLPSDPDTARSELLRVLAKALGDKALKPIGYHDHDWGTADRWSSGCVSPVPPGLYTRFGDALHPPVGQLIWSGTDTADIWAGAMDGAVRSGHAAALQALNSLSCGAT